MSDCSIGSHNRSHEIEDASDVPHTTFHTAFRHDLPHDRQRLYPAGVRATSIGHAGILIETSAGSILCDPWFEPAFFGGWFPFPRNDQLSADLHERIEQADFLYVSHLHGDHHDKAWLDQHLRRDIPILLPGFPTRE